VCFLHFILQMVLAYVWDWVASLFREEPRVFPWQPGYEEWLKKKVGEEKRRRDWDGDWVFDD
jgi:hypothetical protein